MCGDIFRCWVVIAEHPQCGAFSHSTVKTEWMGHRLVIAEHRENGVDEAPLRCQPDCATCVRPLRLTRNLSLSPLCFSLFAVDARHISVLFAVERRDVCER